MTIVYNIFKDFIRDNKAKVTLYLLFSLTYPIKKIIIPHYYGTLLTELMESHGITPQMKNIFYIVIGLWILTMLLGFLMYKLDKKLLPSLQAHFRQALIQRIINDNAEHDVNLNVGSIVTNLSSISYIVQDIASECRDIVLPTIYTIAGSIGYFFFVNPALGLLYTGSISVFLFAIIKSVKRYVAISSKTSLEYNEIFEGISDVLYNVINIYTAGTYKDEIQRLKNSDDNFNFTYSENIEAQSKFRLMFRLSFLGVMLLTIGYALFLYQRRRLETKNMVSVMMVSIYVISQIEECDDSLPTIAHNIGMLINTENDLGKLQEQVKDSPDSIVVTDGEIVVRNLHVPNRITGISLVIPSKRLTIIKGHNGSGKTTLVTSILKLHDYQGDIYIDGQDIRTVNTELLRKHISYIPQDPKLFNRSLFENISYGTGATKEDLTTLLESLGLGNFFGREFDSSVGRAGSMVSGGQRQLIMILRALLLHVPIIILDEPTNALDSAVKRQLLTLLNSLRGRTTVVVITHDPDLLSIADNISELPSRRN